MKHVNVEKAIAAIALLSGLALSCKDEPVQPRVSSVGVSVEGASCTEAWLKVSLADASGPRTVALQRDGQTVLTIEITASDSVVMDEGLLPRHVYAYSAVRMRDTVAVDYSAPVQVTTLDTTSHEFTWQADTIGEGFSNRFNDIAIINDSLAYAAGEIYLRDSIGQIDPDAYSVAVWASSSWSLKRLYYGGSNLIFSTRGVYPATSSDIWLAAGSVFLWDGVTTQTRLSFSRLNLPNPDATVEKLWGAANSILYGVGNAGTIVHYVSGVWRRVESGTTETINDVWGGRSPLLGEDVVVMAVGWRSTLGESKLLIVRGSSEQVDTLAWPYPLAPRRSVWFDRNSRVYTCGAGVYVSSNSGWRYVSELPSIYTKMVRGNGPNDIMVVGDFGLVAHYNGMSWRVYSNTGADSYEAVAIRENLVIAVGWIGTRACTLVGRR